MVAGFFNPQARLYGNVALETTPEELSYRARETLKELGYNVEDAARTSKEAFGFAVNHGELKEIDAQPDGGDWHRRNQPPLVYFWYRTGPDPLFPIEGPGESHIDEHDPPVISEMVGVRLDPSDGKLVRLLVKPSVFVDPDIQPTESIQEVWTKLFSTAGLALKDFEPTERQLNTPVDGHTVGAWTGTAEGSDTPIHIEAAAMGGRPVFFQIGNTHANDRASPFDWLIAGSLITALLLSIYNFWHRRGDRKGAFRVAVFVWIVFFLEAVLTVGFSIVDIPSTFILKTVYSTLGLATMAAIYYIATEPLMRRFSPQTLIGWSRLLAGKWRDPLVGRSVLVGTAVGPIVILLWSLSFLVPEWLDKPLSHPVERTHWQAMSSATAWIPNVLVSASTAIFYAFGIGLGIVLLAKLLRWRWLACIIYTLVAAQLTMPLFYEGVGISGFIFSSAVALLVVVLVRYGLLALVVCLFVFFVGDRLPITLDPGQHYIRTSFWAMAVVLALGICGFLVATDLKRTHRNSARR
ncbi:MAG: hypothetical protein ACI9R3_003712 [Verrucomicrobiales bacterium]